MTTEEEQRLARIERCIEILALAIVLLDNAKDLHKFMTKDSLLLMADGKFQEACDLASS